MITTDVLAWIVMRAFTPLVPDETDGSASLLQ
jgi:hypothetical protein